MRVNHRNLIERIEKLEAHVEAEEAEQVLVVRLIGTAADLRELPEESSDWFTFEQAKAESPIPVFGPRIIYLDSAKERAERLRRAAQAAKN